MKRRIESSEIISFLKSVSFISSLKIIAIDEVLTRSVLRIRCNKLGTFEQFLEDSGLEENIPNILSARKELVGFTPIEVPV